MKDFLKAVLASTIGFFLGSFLMVGFFIFVTIAAVGIAIAMGGSEDKSVSSVEDKSILFINLEGDIEERKTSADVVREIVYEQKPKSIALYELSETLQAAKADKKIQGVYLRLRYTSAGWSKIETLRNMLKDFKTSGKFIYSYSEAYDEKMYYLATVSDQIFLYPKGEFEWDGMYTKPMFYKKLLGKLEVEPQLIRAGKYKSAGEALTQEKMSQENREQVQAIVSTVWNTVIAQMVHDRRSLSVESLNAWAKDVSVSNAQQAYNMKLVDQLLPVEELEQKMLAKVKLKPTDDLRLVSWNAYHGIHHKSSKSSFLSSKDKVAVIIAEGEISSGSGSDNEAIYSDDLATTIRDISEDDEVKAVVLRVNSPGGSALASDVIWRSLEYLKKKKKVVTSFSDVAASGGYYIAAGSDYIYAQPTTITGSIGVFGVLMHIDKFFDSKLGLTFDVVKTHESSDMMTGRKLTPSEVNRVQEQVNYTYKTFLNVVKEGRKSFSDVEAVNEIAQGRVWVGATAKSIGLVDEFGGLNQAIAKAAEIAKLKSYDVVLYPDEKNFLDRFFTSLGDVVTLPMWLQKLLSPSARQDMVQTRMPFVLEM